MNPLEHYLGSLLGLAVGDALGTTLEFKTPGSFAPVTDMIGGGPFRLQPGQWTDDTSMALCLAESLIVCQGMNLHDQLTRYIRWQRDGHLSSTGYCFDFGNTVSRALVHFQASGEFYSGPTDSRSAGNGSLMRLAPVPLFYARQPRLAVHFAGESSRTTHGNLLAIHACQYFAGLLVGAVTGQSKAEILTPAFHPGGIPWQKNDLAPEIYEIANGSFKRRQPPEIRGTGYVVHSLEAALWAFYHSNSFEEGCLLAVNLGDYADTTGAIFGQLAGAFYGESGIPAKWSGKLAQRTIIQDYATQIYHLSQTLAEPIPGW